MIQATELLRSHIRLLRRLSGAGSLTLFAPATSGEAASALRLHDGPLGATDELLDEASGDTLRRRLAAGSAALEAHDAHPRVARLTGGDAACLVFRVEPADAAERKQRRRSYDDVDGWPADAVWIGFRFSDPADARAERLGSIGPNTGGKRAQSEETPLLSLLVLLADLARHAQQVSAILDDPVTGLPGRSEFQAMLEQAVEGAARARKPLAVLLTNPDEFVTVNERFGRDAGDKVIREIAERLRSIHRGSDQIARYGGAIFSSILVGTPLEGARVAATKVTRRLNETTFLDGAVRLGFSVGVAALDPAEDEGKGPLDLIRRVDQALYAAKRSGGNRIAVWDEEAASEEVRDLPAMGGLFTGDMAKDYRNMVLLWDSVTVMAAHSRFDDLAVQVVERLHTTFKPDRVCIFGPAEDDRLRLIQGRGMDPEQEPQLFEGQEALVRRAVSAGHPVEETLRISDPERKAEEQLAAYAIPMVTDSRDLGCLYLDGRADALELDSADLFFLKALAAQLAVGLDRARLAEQEDRKREQESRRLRSELDELRRGLDRVTLEYRSPRMEQLLATTHRLATTDATVLITGESGTGKELLARTVHALSPRRAKPLVIVDCGAITETLIDSELFGHERGAYTGAQERKIGRLAEADGATILLDEIGELPLEVQTKLLRFVQEKQLTPVGGTKPRVVDARVIAATNIDLAARVAAGRFREDLFYRLNVLRLEVPPLRERPEDILHLANHYVEKYVVLYEKGVRRFTPEAQELMRRHGWPGNVRELQNRIMQAVILSEREELGPAQLGLPPRSAGAEPETSGAQAAGGSEGTAKGATTAEERPSTPPDGVAAAHSSVPNAPAEQRLRIALGSQVEAAIGSGSRLALPLGKWLSDDLVLAADAAAGSVARRGAALLGLPQTTFRRRLRKAAEREQAGLSPRPNTWPEVREALVELVRQASSDVEDLMSLTQRILMEEIVARVPGDTRTAAALLGVTEPTFLRRLA
jgi:diguanylate cyclase (GGDEF)-like protein